MIKYVQFTDASKTKILSIFGSPQDPESWPNQGEVEETDARIIEFYAAAFPPVDPARDVRIERDRLISYATLKIDPLQDGVDIEESDANPALLLAWKKYRSALGKVDTKPGWPESPQWPVPPVPIEGPDTAVAGAGANP